MKNYLILSIALVTFMSCGNSGNKNETPVSDRTETVAWVVDESTIYVYYFHGKQRCKTCVAVENVARKSVEENYSGNGNVQFIEVENDEPGNATLTEKYSVTWNALIIAKGNDHIDITRQAFANAVNTPEVLTELIRSEIDKRLIE